MITIKQQVDYKINSSYSPMSPMIGRRYVSDLISIVTDSMKSENTRIFYEVYQYAMNLTNGNCFYCNTKLVKYDGSKTPEQIEGASHWDHFIPAAQWGLFIRGNVVIACVSCNLDKSDAHPREYWDFRKTSKLPLRYKTRDEFETIYKKLERASKKANLLNFNPGTNDEPLDVLRGINFASSCEEVIGFMEKYVPGGSISRWLLNERSDSEVWSELHDLDSYVYKNYGECMNVGLSQMSANDVRGRISRATEYYDETIEGKPITSLTDNEFRLYARGLMSDPFCGGRSVAESTKFKRLVRTLVEHEDLTHLREIAWSL